MKTKEEINELYDKYCDEFSNKYDDYLHYYSFVEGYTQCQEDMIKEIDNLKCQLRTYEGKEPKYAVEGDYCSVCGCTEFWNNGDEEE